MATGESRRAPVFNLRAGRGRRGRIPGSRCNRKLKHERSQSSNKPAPPPSRYTPGKGRRRRRRRGGEGQEDISPLHSPGPFFSSPPPPFSCKRGFPPSRTLTLSPPCPGARRRGRWCQAWERHRPAGPALGTPAAGRERSPRSPLPRRLAQPFPVCRPPAPSGLSRPGKAPFPTRPLRSPRGPGQELGSGGDPSPSLPSASGAGGGSPSAPYLGCRCRLSPRRAAHPSCAPPAAGSGASPGRLWAWRGQGARLGTERSGAAAQPPPARSPAGRGRCAAVRGERDRTHRAEPPRSGEGKGRRGEGGWGGRKVS